MRQASCMYEEKVQPGTTATVRLCRGNRRAPFSRSQCFWVFYLCRSYVPLGIQKHLVVLGELYQHRIGSLPRTGPRNSLDWGPAKHVGCAHVHVTLFYLELNLRWNNAAWFTQCSRISFFCLHHLWGCFRPIHERDFLCTTKTQMKKNNGMWNNFCP